MAMIEFDASDFNKGLKTMNPKALNAAEHGLNSVCEEVLRLSTFEVPHDTGWLQSHGTVFPVSQTEFMVGYNTPYAARLHEHPEFKFQKGRKAKFLEDPIKSNLRVLGQYFAHIVEREFAK